MTRNNIEYDLTKTPYRHKVNNIIYCFSSQLNVDKFRERLEDNRAKVNFSLSNRFNLFLDVSELADFLLYRQIEKRGFLIRDEKGGAFECQNQLQFVGLKVKKKN